ncbi:TetR/AcrR family transcriptional regulator [Paenibacillus pabuli]|uniref:TetR/AcrR family transcriptional regulator n=1 Tax=Paenibacillus pabuli TaxID=1472 RepID=UPI001FFF97C0|nr:TetR/AcrR family transcriptional regulator [Paenibacillus pabuli]UPK41531.1 TetR family transcriptional regulator [Paenibacillus pabuli]
MPKKTFFHLSKDKQDTLIQCAKKEFSRVPLHEASIANIIKAAGISRGSFYQYFEEKEDLYYYLLNQSSQKNNERFIAALKEKNGDLFEAFIVSFQFMIQNHTNQEHKNFFRNAFLNMNYKTEKTFTNNIYEENRKSQLLAIFSLMNTENLNIQGERELQHILKIIIAVTFDNLIQVFVKDLTYEEALKNYSEQMDLLKRGFKKIQ